MGSKPVARCKDQSMLRKRRSKDTCTGVSSGYHIRHFESDSGRCTYPGARGFIASELLPLNLAADPVS